MASRPCFIFPSLKRAEPIGKKRHHGIQGLLCLFYVLSVRLLHFFHVWVMRLLPCTSASCTFCWVQRGRALSVDFRRHIRYRSDHLFVVPGPVPVEPPLSARAGLLLPLHYNPIQHHTLNQSLSDIIPKPYPNIHNIVSLIYTLGTP